MCACAASCFDILFEPSSPLEALVWPERNQRGRETAREREREKERERERKREREAEEPIACGLSVP